MSLFARLTDPLRVRVHALLTTDTYDHVHALKVTRDVLGTLNDLTGRPFCSAEEVERRRVRAGGHTPAPTVMHEPAPVMLYFDGKDHRTRKKMEEVLQAREVPVQVLDVTDDEASRSWAVTAAKMNEFPLLFIAGEPVGGLHELTQLDVNGGLRKRVFGG